MKHETGIDCDHQHAAGKDGLCAACLRDYEEDWESWVEFGPHPAGHENYQRLLDELAAVQPPEPLPGDGLMTAGDDEIPW
jgi:hypothetical protein